MKKVSYILFFVKLSLFAQPVVWNENEVYSVGNLVVKGTSSYIAIQTNINVQPPNTSYWVDLATAAAGMEVPSEPIPPTIPIPLPPRQPDPSGLSIWDSANPLLDGWKEISWFGSYFESSENWLFHQHFGWVYPSFYNETSTWLYSSDLGWFWTSPSAYPFIWQKDENSYSYVMISSTGGTKVYNYSTGNTNSLKTVSFGAIPSYYLPSVNYHQGELVRKSGATYFAFTNSKGQDPEHSSPYWISLSNDFPSDPVPPLTQTDVNAALPTTTPEFFNLTIHSSVGGQVIMRVDSNTSSLSTSSISSSRVFEKDTSITITAVPTKGYLFTRWSGGTSGISVEKIILLNGNMNITAHFERDLVDSDNDGINNYLESNVYFTSFDSNDTDSDGFSDSFEVEVGTNPLVSDSQLVDYISKNPTEFSLVEKTKYDQAMNAYPAQDTHSTPYTSEWFYLPNRGWMWTNNSTFPYFFDQNTSDWLHFENGNTKPTFYEYKTKQWIQIE